jgi:hypothetical protein
MVEMSRIAQFLVSGLLMLLWTQSWAADHETFKPGESDVTPSQKSGVPHKKEPSLRLRWKETADQILIRESEVKWTRYLRSWLNLPRWLDLGLENRTRFESLDYPFRKGEEGTDAQVPQRSRLRIGLDGPGPLRFLVEFQDSRTHVLSNSGQVVFVNNTVVDTTDIQQLFASVTFLNFLETGLRTDVHLGRINMDIGQRRLVARNDFRNTTNAFDGGHLNIAWQKEWRVRAFLVKPTSRAEAVFDQPFGEGGTLFWGLFYENRQNSWVNTDLFYFGLNDESGGNSNRTYTTLGMRLYKSPQKGKFDYEGETVWQFGSTGPMDHFAYFQHAQLGYTFDAPWAPRFLAQYDYASGTRDPNGSQNGTFDSLFGARNFEFTPTGIFGPFFRSNISSPGWRLILQPIDELSLTMKFRVWYLAQARDAWVGSGLQDPTGQSGNFLGEDLQLKAQWYLPFNLQFDFGYDHFFKGSYIQNLAKVPGNPPANDSDYFYALTKVRF